jgi:hypothetical protein
MVQRIALIRAYCLAMTKPALNIRIAAGAACPANTLNIVRWSLCWRIGREAFGEWWRVPGMFRANGSGTAPQPDLVMEKLTGDSAGKVKAATGQIRFD